MGKNDALWKRLVKHLLSTKRWRHKIVVRRVYMADHGTTSFTQGTITVSIRAQDPWSVQVDTLGHELAHAWQYTLEGDHNDQWGQYNAEFYRAREQFFEGEE